MAVGKATATTMLVLCVLLVAAAQPLDAAACNPSALSPCGGARFGGAVKQGCCVQLKKQQPCLCRYVRDPAYSNYVDGPAAQSLTKACGLPRIKR
uniref:Bifunctional inhibitor/plant lipid transfer protein/seed storage helical domain-containing protein n=1 Tax=Setaria italica TaxID=4555 RepID=K3XQY8_SETIT